MAFPLTHLCVAQKILEMREISSPEQFMLGSIAPDAVHYRAEFTGAAMSNIGPTKKITHLCPVSDERWGQVTDNDGWVECVREFLRAHPNNTFAQGYAVHVLTDIQNNLTLWNNFRTNHPEEAAKGYKSDYYEDLRKIDTLLYLEYPNVNEILDTLSRAKPEGIDDIIFPTEVQAIQQNLLHEHFANAKKTSHKFHFVTWEDTLDYIHTAAEFCVNVIL
jgi:hypothetical protein